MSVEFRNPFGMLAREIVLELPEVYGIGLGFRSNDGRVAASFEWDRVEYSSITESAGLTNVVLDDGDEIHAGVEYLFLDSSLLWSVRGGAWLDPDHLTRHTGSDPFDKALHPPGDDEMHYSLGVGFVLPPFQVDFAIDIFDAVDTVSVSAIYSF